MIPGSGELKWETPRRGRATWASPVIATFNGEPQVIINGNPEVTAFNAVTGKELWTIEVLTGDVAPSLAVNSQMVYAVTDYARLAAVKPGPGPSIVWEDNMFTSDVSSPVALRTILFIATGTGDVACYDAMKGDTLWTKYFSDQFYASPIVADEKVWLARRTGVMHIINAGPEYQLIAESPLGEPSDCTPAFSDKNIYIRGQKQPLLYFSKLKEDTKHTEPCNCDGESLSVEEITSAVDEVVKETGTEKEKVIQILQEVQKRLNYLPSEALKHICRVTEVTPGQISGVSTFYSQFRHIPSGRHTIKICAGTACHVKGVTADIRSFQKGSEDTERKKQLT